MSRRNTFKILLVTIAILSAFVAANIIRTIRYSDSRITVVGYPWVCVAYDRYPKMSDKPEWWIRPEMIIVDIGLTFLVCVASTWLIASAFGWLKLPASQALQLTGSGATMD
ncbi:MAG: hypothetical protein IT445_12370 [Phycisphaeraceae bacterium]|nr:hypothetical protein [Phycisphaeraceae bacterium]